MRFNAWCAYSLSPDVIHAGGQVLRSPAAATVVAAARGSGLDDLTATRAPAQPAAKGKPAGRSARKQGRAAGKGPATGKLAQAIMAAAAAPVDDSRAAAGGAAVAEADWDAEVQAAETAQADARRAWNAFTAAAAAATVPATPAAEGDTAAGQGQYLHRLPTLAWRLGNVLQGSLYAEPAADTPLIEGAAAILPLSACQQIAVLAGVMTESNAPV